MSPQSLLASPELVFQLDTDQSLAANQHSAFTNPNPTGLSCSSSQTNSCTYSPYAEPMAELSLGPAARGVADNCRALGSMRHGGRGSSCDSRGSYQRVMRDWAEAKQVCENRVTQTTINTTCISTHVHHTCSGGKLIGHSVFMSWLGHCTHIFACVHDCDIAVSG